MIRCDSAARAALAAVLAAACLLLGACQSGHTYVLDAPRIAEPVSCGGLTVRAGGVSSSADVDAEQSQAFELALIAALNEAPQVSEEEQGGGETIAGPGTGFITLEYRIVLHEKGNAPMRFGAFFVSLVGIPVSNFGEGDVGVEVTYTDDHDRRLAHIVVDGPIDGPVAGTHDGLGTAAEQIAAFTRERFRYTTVEPIRPDSQ